MIVKLIVNELVFVARLCERLNGENAQELRDQLRNFDCFVDLETELKVWSFLETRMKLLMRCYESAAFTKYITGEVSPLSVFTPVMKCQYD